MSVIKKGSKVKVICGDDKGKEGIVLDMLRKKKNNRILVSGINIATKHVKSQGNNPGKIIKKELPIHISNLRLIQ